MDLEPIKSRLAAATPGPWRAQEFDSYPGDEGSAIVGGYSVGLVAYAVRPDFGAASGYDEAQCDRDATFIAHAPTDVAALIAEVERLRGQIDAVKKIHEPEEYENPNTFEQGYMCSHCYQENGEWAEYPCPTIRALDGEES